MLREPCWNWMAQPLGRTVLKRLQPTLAGVRCRLNNLDFQAMSRLLLRRGGRLAIAIYSSNEMDVYACQRLISGGPFKMGKLIRLCAEADACDVASGYHGCLRMHCCSCCVVPINWEVAKVEQVNVVSCMTKPLHQDPVEALGVAGWVSLV